MKLTSIQVFGILTKTSALQISLGARKQWRLMRQWISGPDQSNYTASLLYVHRRRRQFLIQKLSEFQSLQRRDRNPERRMLRARAEKIEIAPKEENFWL